MLKVSREERKDFIADIATKVFSKKGYQATSLREVALEVGVSKAGIYHYFKSKEDILAYILLRNSSIFLDTLKDTLKKNEQNNLKPLDSFKTLMKVYAFHINKKKEKRQIVLQERHQLTGSYRKELYKKEQAIFRLLKNELQKIPELDESLNLNVITFTLISMSHWLGYWFKEGKELDLNDIIEQNIFIILRGSLNRDYRLNFEWEEQCLILDNDPAG